jgi:uncharacterized protein (DUF697 family)
VNRPAKAIPSAKFASPPKSAPPAAGRAEPGPVAPRRQVVNPAFSAPPPPEAARPSRPSPAQPARKPVLGNTAIRFEPPDPSTPKGVEPQKINDTTQKLVPPVQRAALPAESTSMRGTQDRLPIPEVPSAAPAKVRGAATSPGEAVEEITPPVKRARKAPARKAANKALSATEPMIPVEPPSPVPETTAPTAGTSIERPAPAKATRSRKTPTAPVVPVEPPVPSPPAPQVHTAVKPEPAASVPAEASPQHTTPTTEPEAPADQAAVALHAEPAVALQAEPEAPADQAAVALHAEPAVALQADPPPATTGPGDRDLLTAIRTNPARAPELLAVAAVHRLAPEARLHTDWLRTTYPAASNDGLARLAAQEFVRKARAQGTLAGLIGPAAVLAETVTLTLLQARMVLRIAAAYGHNPSAPVRAAELLVLQQFHADVPAAEAAIAGHGPARRTSARLAIGVVARAFAAKLLPAPLIGGMTSARLTEQLAARATTYYRTKP